MSTLIKNNFRIWWLQVLYMFFGTAFLSQFSFYLVKREVPIEVFLLAEGVACLVVCVCLAFGRTVSFRKWLAWGFLVSLAAVGSLLLPFSHRLLIAPYIILGGIGEMLFFVPYNILFFRQTQAQTQGKATKMTIYWSLSIVVGVIGPFVGGYLLASTSLPIFVISSAVFLVGALVLTRYVPNEKQTYSLAEIFGHLRGLRTITSMDGALQKINGIVIGLYAIKFFSRGTTFGAYLSCITLVAVLVALGVAKHSDKTKKRLTYIVPLSLGTALLLFVIQGVTSVVPYMAIVVLLQAIAVSLEPLRANVIQDTKEPSALLWISRELYLNIGRALFFLVAAGLLHVAKEPATFILFGAMHICFVLLLYTKKVYRLVGTDEQALGGESANPLEQRLSK